MELRFFDAHTHVQFPAFDRDRDAVMERALEASVGVVNAGSTTATSARAVEIADTYQNAWATVGIHPGHAGPAFHDVDEMGLGGDEEAKRVAAEGEAFDATLFARLAMNPKVVGVGECGLDYFRLAGDIEKVKEKQRELFLMHVRFAHEVRKPLVIHCRPGPTAAGGEAMIDLIAVLSENRSLLNLQNAGFVHFFTGSVDNARALLDLGFSFTFGGVVTYPKRPGKPDYDDVIRFVPADRILSETDAPDVAPVPYRGKRSEPVYVVEVVKRLAEVRGVPLEEFTKQLRVNVGRVFGI
jgi:TatD DNase family protein